MLLSRGLTLLKTTYRYNRPKNAVTNMKHVRLGHHEVHYRSEGKPDKISVALAEVFGGFAWWWVLWHLYHDYGHIIGEFDYPEPSNWTDAELGIPPDD